jgi:WD40 repeat protein
MNPGFSAPCAQSAAAHPGRSAAAHPGWRFVWTTLQARRALAAGCLAVAVLPAAVVADPLPVKAPERTDKVRFEEEVLPFLAANCTACHNAKVREGGLMLDSVKSIVAGGDSGPGVVAGKPAESVVFLRATHRQDDAMPPADNKVGAKPLSPEQLGMLERWIAEGAVVGPAVVRQPVAWRPLPRGAGPVVAVAVTEDGRRAAAARGSSVGVFDARSGRLLETLVDPAAAAGDIRQSHRDAVAAVAFAPGGDRLATGSYRTIKIWKRSPPTRLAEVAESANATALAIAPGGTVAALGFADGKLAIVDVAAGKLARTVPAHSAAVTGLAFAADGATLHSVGRDGHVLTTQVADGTATGRLQRQGELRAVALLSGGTRLATAEADNVVRIWQLPLPRPTAEPVDPAQLPKPMKELGGIAQPTVALAELPTMSGHLFTGSGDGIVRLWNADTAAIVRQFAHEAPVVAVAVSPDGGRLATVGTVPGVKLWETASGKKVVDTKGDHRIADRLAAIDLALAVDKQDVEFAKAQVTAAEKAVQTAADESKKAAEQVAATEKNLAEKATAADAATKAKQEADAGSTKAAAAVPVATQVHEAATKVAMAAAASQTSAAAAVAALKAKPADPANAEQIKAVEAAAAGATAAKAAADQAVVQAAQQVEKAKKDAADAAKKLTDATTAETAAVAAKMQAEQAVTVAKRTVEFATEQGKRTAADVPARTADRTAAEARLAAAEEARKKPDAENTASNKPFLAASYSADGSRLVCLEADGRMVVLGGADGLPRATWDGARPAGPGMAAFLSGSRLVVAGGTAPAAVWDVAEPWTLERTIGGELTPPANDDDPTGPPVDIVTALAFSPDGALLASGGGRASRSGEVKLWKVSDGSLTRPLAMPHSDTVMALEFSRRGDMLASGGADRFLKVHAVADGKPVRAYEGHTGHVLGVSWQANGRRLASAGADNAVKVWDVASGEQQKTIAVGKKEVTAVRFVGAGDEVIAAAGDPALRLYNATSGAVVREFRDPAAFLQAATVATPFVIAGGQDGKLRIWDLAAGTLAHAVEAVPAK